MFLESLVIRGRGQFPIGRAAVEHRPIAGNLLPMMGPSCNPCEQFDYGLVGWQVAHIIVRNGRMDRGMRPYTGKPAELLADRRRRTCIAATNIDLPGRMRYPGAV
jgi:hypothetical protein